MDLCEHDVMDVSRMCVLVNVFREALAQWLSGGSD